VYKDETANLSADESRYTRMNADAEGEESVVAGDRLTRLLEDWFREEVATSPAEDPRRTPLCLRFHELSGVAEESLQLSEDRAAHVRECGWCQRSLTAYRAADAAAEASISISVGLEGQWPPELRDCLRRWLKKMARQEHGQAAPAHFDDEGTFHMRWRGLEVGGPVKVSLMWEGVELPLARGVVEQGTLEITEPMPGLGVRNVEVSQRLLRVRPEDAP
jgi:hypothetical protein